MDRRRFIELAILGATSTAMPGCASTGRNRRGGLSNTEAVVDIHAYFFNASDIPVADFIDRVVLKDHETFEAQSEFRTKKIRNAIIRLLTRVLFKDAVEAKYELNQATFRKQSRISDRNAESKKKLSGKR